MVDKAVEVVIDKAFGAVVDDAVEDDDVIPISRSLLFQATAIVNIMGSYRGRYLPLKKVHVPPLEDVWTMFTMFRLCLDHD